VSLERFLDFLEDIDKCFSLFHRKPFGRHPRQPFDDLWDVFVEMGILDVLQEPSYPVVRHFLWVLHGIDVVHDTLFQELIDNNFWDLGPLVALEPGDELLELL